MKNLQLTLKSKLVILLIFCFVINNNLLGQTDSTVNEEKTEKTIEKNKKESKSEEKKSKSGEIEKNEEVGNYPKISEKTIQYISIGFFVIMIVLISLFFYSKRKAPYFGFHSIKFIGLILIFPGICILALISKDLINGATLAALFGTIAGYVLSRDKEDDSSVSSLAEKYEEEKDKLEKEKKELEDKVSKLESDIKKLGQGTS